MLADAHSVLTLKNIGAVVAIIIGVGTILASGWRVIAAINRLVDQTKENKAELEAIKQDVADRHAENVAEIQAVSRDVKSLKTAFRRFQKQNTKEHATLYEAVQKALESHPPN